MMYGQTDSTALLNHIVAQTRANVEFLVSQHQLTDTAAKEIIAKLPAPSDPHVDSLANDTQNLLIRAPPPPPAPVPSYTSPQPGFPKARAIWGYNEDRKDPNDLYFSAGDIIEIVAETNADWWTGRHNGSEGLFPANYVERLPHDPPAPAPPQRGPSSYTPYPPTPTNYPPPAGPPMPAYQVPYQPPQPYQPSYQPQYQPPAPQPPVVQQAPAPEPKKSKFGGMGNTLAHSAVGGVGFGAGTSSLQCYAQHG
ncbi:SH3 domain-containing protein [Mucidula mucida]|nr:SH3 domain-containing protein [Mucidula mucida]